jgi:hypothetical protein
MSRTPVAARKQSTGKNNIAQLPAAGAVSTLTVAGMRRRSYDSDASLIAARKSSRAIKRWRALEFSGGAATADLNVFTSRRNQRPVHRSAMSQTRKR